MSDKRITPEEVVEAYRVTGLKPVRHTARPFDGQCCGVGAISIHRGAKPGDGPITYLETDYGRGYLWAFVDGFDNLEIGTFAPDPKYRRCIDGYADGQSCAAAVGLGGG